jgi:type IV pilus assembly protein PilW
MRRNEPGFTLIEILIALAIAGIISTAIYNLYISQSRIYTQQEQVSDMQQNARVAMDIISRHVRMAGFGKPGWTTINGTAGINYEILVTDGGSAPDTLEIVGCIDAPPGTLSAAVASGATAITLHSSAEASKFNTTTKRDIFVGDLENAKVTNVSGAVLTIDTDPGLSGQGLGNAYPAGTNVYLVKRVTYTITGRSLRRNENTGAGAQEVAVNIEDLQVTYAEPVVTVSITARTQGRASYYTGDGYRRMTLTSDIIARNLD